MVPAPAPPRPVPPREPCPHCGQAAALAAVVCRFCKKSLLVDVVLPGPVTDPAHAREVAQATSDLGPPCLSLAELQRSLASPRPVVARGATRARARDIVAFLSGDDLEASTVSAAPPPRRHPLAGLPGRWVAAAAAGALVLGAGLGLALLRARSGRELTAAEIAARSRGQVALVECRGSSGHGVFVGPDLLLTSASAICPGDEMVTVTLHGGERREGYPAGRHPETGLATVRVPGAGAHPVPLGDASALSVGDRVVVLGQEARAGRVSHLGRGALGATCFQLDASFADRDLGVPVMDSRGRLVGLVWRAVGEKSDLGLAAAVNHAYDADLVGRPADAAYSDRWAEMLREAREDDAREREEVLAAFAERPGLVAVVPRGPTAAAAIVLRRAPRAPLPEPAAFRIVRGDEVVCYAPDALLQGWVRADEARRAADAPVPDRYLDWLTRQGLTEGLWIGFALLPEGRCNPRRAPAGTELVLANADRNAERVPLGSER